MTQRLFKRNVRVTCWRETVPEDATNFQVSRYPEQTEITDLRVQFKIEKNVTKEPNSCEITVTNLAETTRFELQRKPLFVRLDAGYDGDLKRLFAGDLRQAHSVWEGPDCHTSFDFGDGDRAFRYARANRSFAAGVTARAVLDELASAMGLTVPRNVRESRDFEVQLAAGYALQGQASRDLDRILTPLGRTWSIQDGRLQILKVTEVRNDAPLELSQDSGMLGSPERGAPLKKGGKPLLVVRSLLYPEVTPGGRVRVKSREIEGVFKVMKLTHEGDTAGSDWMTTVEALPV